VVRELQAAGNKVVVCGDGTADRCAADAADFVFATRRLIDHCRERALPHREFQDFLEVMAHFPR
jgi:2-hydroxy-3-keto-5-methylthiopentenyl-1-phosphate phosphatase